MLHTAASLVLLLLVAGYVYWSLIDNLEREDNAVLADKVEFVRNVLRDHPRDLALFKADSDAPAPAGNAPRLMRDYVCVRTAAGVVVVETPGMGDLLAGVTFPPPASPEDLEPKSIEVNLGGGRAVRMMSAWGAANGERFLIHVALDASHDEAMRAGFRRNLIVLVVVGLVFAGGAGVFVARRGLRPLEDIARATERITASHLHERIIAEGWPRELASLARGMDGMLTRLEDSFNRLKQFSGDLAHELRTPINNLRGEAGVALSQVRTPEQYRRVLESSLEEYARLTRLIENLLFLARAEGPMSGITRSPCDVRPAIEAVREYYEALAEDRGVRVGCEGDATTRVDPLLLRQAVNNLLANALNHTPRGGEVRMVVTLCADGSTELAVSDNGTGISAEHLPKIFDRFYRVDPARAQPPNGSGLGLAIVKSIMTLHGGSVRVESELGKGSRFTLRFPAAAAEGA